MTSPSPPHLPWPCGMPSSLHFPWCHVAGDLTTYFCTKIRKPHLHPLAQVCTADETGVSPAGRARASVARVMSSAGVPIIGGRAFRASTADANQPRNRPGVLRSRTCASFCGGDSPSVTPDHPRRPTPLRTPPSDRLLSSSSFTRPDRRSDPPPMSAPILFRRRASDGFDTVSARLAPPLPVPPLPAS